MQDERPAGFEEVEHTADWQLNVWAPTLAGLFTQAARGMYALSNIKFEAAEREVREVSLEAYDLESLLVAFLSELLYWIESEKLAFELEHIRVDNTEISASLVGGRITRQDKEIKAVTFHNIHIERQDGLYRVSVVFDV